MDKMIKDDFVSQVLQHQGKRLLTNQERALRQKVRFRTGRISSSRSVQVSSGNGMDGQLTLQHLDYLRFLDMKGHKGKRKRRRIHNRFMFGTYYAIANQLSTGLTESVYQEIREKLNRTING